jgi:hypothetical protein
MQAWDIYRAEKDPSENWYNGELWFFDNWVIPLASQLKECGVMGASSDECLTQARQNHKKWEMVGEQLCSSMQEKAKKKCAMKRHRVTQGMTAAMCHHHKLTNSLVRAPICSSAVRPPNNDRTPQSRIEYVGESVKRA